jgi:peptidyl-prolyl cis-trans isomerase C/peptidyl-prolyl cis-trans isomerase D
MKKLTWLLAGVFAVIAAVQSVRLAIAATELARINSTVITLEDFNKKYRENLKFYQFRAPTKKGVLDDLIKRELGIQEARKAGLDKDPDVIDRMNTVLYHALLDRKLSKDFEGIHIEDSEAKSFYGKNPEIRTSHIFVAARPDATDAEKSKAMAKIKDIQDKQLKGSQMSFAEVAQRFSEGVAAPMGGDIDYQTKDKLDPTYYETAIKLGSPGKVSGIVQSQFGYHIIKLTAIRPWEEADKAQVKRLLFEEKRSQIFEKYMTQLRGQAKVSVKNELIRD